MGVARGRHAVLLADQVAASGSNALALLLAARALPASDLNRYALVQLVVTTAIGFQRAGLLEPALSLRRPGEHLDLVPRWLVRVLLPLACVVAVGGGVSTGRVGLGLAALVLPLAQDALRYRALGRDQMRRVLMSDWGYVALVIVGYAVVPVHDLVRAAMVWGLAALPPALVLLPGRAHGRATGHQPGEFRRVAALGRFQLSDNLIASCTVLVPVTLVERVWPGGSVGAFRLAQTIMGPYNIFASSLVLNVLLRAADVRELTNSAVARLARRTALVALVAALVYSAVAAVVLLVASGHFDPSLRARLPYVFVVVAVGAVTGSSAIAYIAVLRGSAQQRLGVVVRVKLLVVNVASLLLGLGLWWRTGFDPLVLPVLLTAAASSLLWRRCLQRWMSQRTPTTDRAHFPAGTGA